MGELAPPVDVRDVLEEVGPELAPLQVALHPPVRLAERLEVHELERAGLPARLELGNVQFLAHFDSGIASR